VLRSFKILVTISLENLLQKIENLENLVNLEELWLGKNKITKLEVRNLFSCWTAMAYRSCQGLQNLKKLQVLSLQSNRITKLEGLEELTELNQLYLSHNGIQRLGGLDNNVRLFPNLFSLSLNLIHCEL
jgi:protein phosphatase 1 regulatory subunit 7